VRSRWFAPVLAFVQTALYFAVVAHAYWAASHNEKSFDIQHFISRDLARPLFEPYEFCGAWTHYTGGQALLLSWDFPAYVAAALAYSVGARQTTCMDALMTPRGQLFTAPFVAALWFLVGLTVRRLAQHRWRQATRGRIARIILFLGLTPLPFGALVLTTAAVLFLFFHVEMAARFAGFGFWFLFLPTFSAERLRLWPFKPI
jgi:hypothetical protein